VAGPLFVRPGPSTVIRCTASLSSARGIRRSKQELPPCPRAAISGPFRCSGGLFRPRSSSAMTAARTLPLDNCLVKRETVSPFARVDLVVQGDYDDVGPATSPRPVIAPRNSPLPP